MPWTTLKSNVLFSRFEDGVVFRGGATPVIFRGKRAHDVVSAAVDLMARGLPLEAVPYQFPGAAQPFAKQLLAELQKHKLLRERDESDPEPEHTLAPRFLSLWNYLADHLPRPGAALMHWQRTTFELNGPAEGSIYAARALAECAAENIVITAKSISEQQADALRALRADFDALNLQVRALETAVLPSTMRGISDTLQIFCAGDQEFSSSPDEGVSNAWYFGLLSSHLVIGFVDGRLAERLPDWRMRIRPALPSGSTGRLSRLRIALGAAAVTFAAFNRHTGIDGNGAGSNLRVVDLASQLLPIQMPSAPWIQPEGHVLPVSVTAPPPGMDLEAQIASASCLFDPIGGILEEDEIDLVQVPLSIVALRVSCYDRGAEPLRILGWGNTVTEARDRAIRRSVRAHLWTIPCVGTCAAAVSAEWLASASRAEAIASALASMDGDRAAEPLPISALTDPEVRKLYKILTLLTAAEPSLTMWQQTELPCASVEVWLLGRRLSTACAASMRSAAYEALGDACMATQLDSMMSLQVGHVALSVRSLLNGEGHLSKANTPPKAGLETRHVDLGYTELRDLLHCSLVAKGADPC